MTRRETHPLHRKETTLKSSRSKIYAALVSAPLVIAATGLLIAATPLERTTNDRASNNRAANHPAAVNPAAGEISRESLDVAHALSSAFRNVSNKVLPSVVAIENRPDMSWQSEPTSGSSRDGMADGKNPFQGTPFEDMFRGRSPRMQPHSQAPKGGIGSGVIIDSSGIILTNNHVVAGGGKVIVRTQDGREFEAIEVVTDPKTDIAVVKIQGNSNLTAAPLGNSDLTSVGDWVVALGQPFGLEGTVTAGIVSAKNRGIGITDRENFIQTDAAINPGNSGGPLVNLHGEVIGINTAISSRDGDNSGIGFAVPSNLARWVSDQLIATGTVKRSYLGVGIQPVSYDLASQLGVPPGGGVAVTDVFPGTPAAKTGLKAGDVIIKFGDHAVSKPQQLQLAVERSAVGVSVAIGVIRDGKPIVLTFDPANAPGDLAAPSGSSGKSANEGVKMGSLGVEIMPMTPEVAKQLGMKDQSGLVITMVQKASPAAKSGLKPGMVIAQANQKDVRSVSQFESIVKADEDRSVLLLVRSEKGSRFVVVNR